jgi:uncharacterized protein YndB with AHSA1/START domain
MDTPAAPQTVYRTVIRRPPEEVWRALTENDTPRSWMWDTTITSTWQPGAPYAMSSPENDLIVGEVIEADAPRLLVATFDARWSEEASAEPAGQLSYLLDDAGNGATELTVTISGLSGSTARDVVDDTPGIYTDLKDELEGDGGENTGGGS